jgi:glycosyltransferase involved in cell wall biosynthesis
VLSPPLNFFTKLLFRELINQADAIVCVSEAQRNILTMHMPRISHKTSVIYNPLPDLAPLEIVGKDLGYFGGLDLLKGFKVLCNALAFLNDPSVKVHVTGLSNTNERIMKSLSRSGMLLHKKLDYDKQEAFYKQIKAVVFPSIVPEPLPYVTAEAMLRARILIASRIGGIPEQVNGCRGVFLFEPGNYHQLAKILRNVNDLDIETISDLGHKNREFFTKTFSNQKTISRFLSIIDCLIS